MICSMAFSGPVAARSQTEARHSDCQRPHQAFDDHRVLVALVLQPQRVPGRVDEGRNARARLGDPGARILVDPDLDKLLEQGAGEIDPAKRAAVYGQAQKRIMDHAVYFPIHNQVNPIAYRANRAGYRMARAQWNVRFYEVDEVK